MSRKKAGLIIAMVMLAITLIFFAGVYLNNYLMLKNIRAERDRAREELEDLQEKNEALSKEREYTQTEQFIREMARSALGYVFPGEYKIVE